MDRFWIPSLAQTPTSPEGGALESEHHKLAANWLRARNGIVLAPSKQRISDFSEYRGLQACSPRSSGSKHGPVLALFPTVQMLRQAELLAHDSSLCVFGGYEPRLDYWCETHDAKALSGYRADWLDPIDHDAQERLKGTISFTGRNNFSGPHEKRHARSTIETVVNLAQPPTVEQVGAHLAAARNIRQSGYDWFMTAWEALAPGQLIDQD